MALEGGCYCGNVRYTTEGDALFKGQCFCRECQHVTGGSPVVVMAVPAGGFNLTKGALRGFTRSDLENPVTREFCENCGTHIDTRAPSMPDAVLLKVGTLDDPSVFGGPDMAIFCAEKQAWHSVPEGVTAFDRTPGG